MHYVHHNNSSYSFVLIDYVLDDLVDAVLAHLPVQELDLDLQGRRLRLFGVFLHEELEAELDVALLNLGLILFALAAAFVCVHRLFSAVILDSAAFCRRLARGYSFLFLKYARNA